MVRELEIHHPLIGCWRPTVNDLLSRCDDEARKILELACRLADYRLKLNDKERPYNGTDQELQVGPIPIYHDLTAGLCSADLMRALLARYPWELRKMILGDIELSPGFGEAVKVWSQIAAQLPSIYQTSAIEKYWGRRWRLTLQFKPGLEINMSTLFGAVDYRTIKGFKEWSLLYSKELMTKTELYSRLAGNMRLNHISMLMDVKPAYFDRHRGLNTLDVLFAESPVVIVTGKRYTGRSLLLKAWLYRFLLKGIPDFMDAFNADFGSICKYAENPFPASYIPTINLSEIERSDEPHFFALMNNIPERVGGSAWTFKKTGEEHWDRLRDSSVEIIEGIISRATARPDRFRLALTLTPEEYRELSHHIPQVSNFPVMPIPPIKKKEVLPIWLCQLPDYVYRGYRRITLPEMFAVLESSRNTKSFDRIYGKPDSSVILNIREIIRHERLFWINIVDSLGRSERWGEIIDMARNYNLKDLSGLPDLSSRERRILELFVGDMKRFQEIIRLEEKLLNM